jgi:membrane associated rhomboid family serine protease
MLGEIRNDIQEAFRGRQNGVVQLLVINAAVFLFIKLFDLGSWASGSGSVGHYFLHYLGLSPIPQEFFLKFWTLLTYSVLHTDLWHLVFNMISLYIFGQILQDFLGHKSILRFYLAGAFSGAVLFLLMAMLLKSTGAWVADGGHLHGASGAVYGIICAAAFLVPNYSINLLFFGPVRLKYVALIFVLISLIQIPAGNPGGNIAHLGGAFGGVMYLRYLQGAFRFRKPSLFRSKKEGKVVPLSSGRKFSSEEAELDYLLDKISEKGIHSLSRDEKNRLEDLSKPRN